MPQPDNCVKLTMQFDLVDGGGAVQDHAEFRIWSDPPHTGGTVSDAWLLDAADFAATSWDSVVSPTHYSPAVVLSGAVMGQYNTAGLLTAEQKFVVGASPWQGTASQSLPWSISAVIGLYTYPRGSFVVQGKSKRGRIYLPPLGTNIMGNSVTALMSATTAQGLRDDIGTWLTGLVGHSGPGGYSFHPGVLSVTHNYFNELGQLSVDTKLDTQRRREKQQQAVIYNVDWP